MRKKLLLNGFTRDYLKSLFRYDAKTGKLFWKIARSNVVWVGKEAGTIGSHGYRIVNIDHTLTLTHKIIFFLKTEEIPEEIDHKDMNKLNNKFRNFRRASRTTNARNVKRTKRNTSGFKGVSLHSETGLWRARIRVGAEQPSLGLYTSRRAAARAYDAAARKYFGKFACVNNV